MPVRNESGAAIMDGTTLCPYCDTRFKIAVAQLNAHQGMVRCGHCRQIFNANENFTPAPSNPQLELPIPETHETPATQEQQAQPELKPVEQAEAIPEETPLPEFVMTFDVVQQKGGAADEVKAARGIESKGPAQKMHAVETDSAYEKAIDDESGDDVKLEAASAAKPVRSMTLAERVIIVQDDDDSEMPQSHRRTWLWALAVVMLSLTLLAQAAYYFRVDIAALRPELKPALTEYCKLLNCTIPLPQNSELVSIESSSLEAVPAHADMVVLNVLTRNRAPYAQAFPHLELTLNDSQDQPLARRVFRPKDYLPLHENEEAGFQPDRELVAKLLLDTTDLKPSGYRLVLFYPE